ncbi:MAG: hypothetical protein AAB131_07840 [Actinomycetota bacterium]
MTTSLSVHFHHPGSERLRVVGTVQHNTARSALVNVVAHHDVAPGSDPGPSLIATAVVTFLTVTDG